MSHHNVGLYHLKWREREQWTTTTIKGPRRVWRMTKWKRRGTFADKDAALQGLDNMRAFGGLKEWAVFFLGKRITR